MEFLKKPSAMSFTVVLDAVIKVRFLYKPNKREWKQLYGGDRQSTQWRKFYQGRKVYRRGKGARDCHYCSRGNDNKLSRH